MTRTHRLLAASAAALLLAGSAHAATFSSTAAYGSWTYGSYTFNNDVWGSGAGAETIWANSNTDWGVTSDQPATSGIKSYPHIAYNVNKTISALTTLTSKISATTPSGGAWESAFDIWDSTNAHEIMLWLNYTGTSAGCGNVKPISYNWSSAGCAIPVYSNVTVGGSTWNVYEGTNGSNLVYSFLRTTKTNNVTVDIKAILTYLEGLGWLSNVTVGSVQYGFEITSTAATTVNFDASTTVTVK